MKNILIYVAIFILGGLSVLTFLEIKNAEDHSDTEIAKLIDNSNGIKKEVRVAEGEIDTAGKDTASVRADIFIMEDFSVTLPEGWTIEPVKGRYVATKDDQRFDIFGTSGTYSDSSGKYGELNISYDTESKCWTVGRSNERSGYVEVLCSEPDGYISGRPYFAGLGQQGYIIVELIDDKASFIVFDDAHLSVEYGVLREVFDSIEFK